MTFKRGRRGYLVGYLGIRVKLSRHGYVVIMGVSRDMAT